MGELLLVDKPKGISSFDVIRELRRRFGVRKMGHAGTLDPMATGLLIVGVGSGTKRLKDFVGLPKTYRMSVLLGLRTDTGDVTGRPIEERPVGSVPAKRVRAILAEMIGELELPIPMYSAVKHSGRPLYRYARQGIAVPQKTRKTPIIRLELIAAHRDVDGPVLDLELEAGSGTYARAVAEEIGRRIGAPATLAELRRTKIGGIDVARATQLDKFPERRK